MNESPNLPDLTLSPSAAAFMDGLSNVASYLRFLELEVLRGLELDA